MVIGHDRPWLKEDLWTNQYVPRKWDTHQGLKNRAQTEPQDLQGTECHRTRRRRPTGVTSPTWQTATRPPKGSSDCCEEITHDHRNIIYESFFFRFFHFQVFSWRFWLIQTRLSHRVPKQALQSPSVSSHNMVNSWKDRSQRPKRYL